MNSQPDMILEKWYVDESASGSNFNRSAFEEMLADLKTGKVVCIIVKYLPRFSRDFIGAGYYTEKYFPLNNIRFISIAEKFDTYNNIYETDNFGNPKHNFRLTNALNEAVAKDILSKTSAKLNVLAKEGCFIAPRAPFGYVKKTKHKLGIDSDAAKVVKEIFNMAENGVGITEITRNLNQGNILTPMEYSLSKGITGNYNVGSGKWSTRTVKDILTNITYVGHLCQGKNKITVYNTHVAIIEQDLFDEVQRILRDNLSTTPKAIVTDNALKGKVICACCGSKMQRRKGSGNAVWHYFTCITNNRQGSGNCEGMYIRESEITKQIKQDIEDFIFLTEPTIKKMSVEKQELREQMFILDTEDAKSKALRRSYYEQFCLGEITGEEYRVMADAITYHTEEIIQLDKGIKDLDVLREKYNFYVKVQQKKFEISELLKKYVDKVVIDSKERIRISYLQQGEPQ